MSSNDNFQVLTLRTLLVVVSLAIMLPIVEEVDNVSFYATVSVYVLGKLIDLGEKMLQCRTKAFFVFYLLGICFGVLIIAMCFYVFALPDRSAQQNVLIYNYVLLGLTVVFCAVDVIEFISGVCRLYYTKSKLKHIS